MKKQISMLLATACAASLLAACGGSGSTAASASAADSTAASSEETAADAASLYENAQKPDKLVWWVRAVDRRLRRQDRHRLGAGLHRQ